MRTGSAGEQPGSGHSPQGFGPRDFDIKAVHGWLGAPVAMLRTPPSAVRHVGETFADTAAGSPSGTTPQVGTSRPVYAVVRHLLADDKIVDVSSRRLYGHDATLLEHIWSSMVVYELASASRAGVTWPGGLPPAEVLAHLDLARVPSVVGDQTVTVDGSVVSWTALVDRDVSTGAELVGCGGEFDGAYLAVVGSPEAMNGLSIETWPPRPALQASEDD